MVRCKLVIVGAGGFGRETLDVLEAVNGGESRLSSAQRFDFVGFLDDGAPDISLLDRLGVEHVGSTGDVARLPPRTQYVIAVAEPTARRRLVEVMQLNGLEPATLVHPSATFGADVEVGPGSIVCAHVSVTTNVRIGDHVQLNPQCALGHDVRIASFTTVLPGATVSGNVELGEGVVVGTNAAIIQGLKVGSGTVIGAGAAVVRNMPAGVVAVGVPARALPQG